MAIANLVLLGLLICSYFSGWPKAFEPLIDSEYGAKLLLICMVGFPLFLLLQLAGGKWLHSRWGRFLLQCAGVPFLAYLWSLYPPLPVDAWSFDLFARSAAMLIIPLCGLFLLRSPKPDTAQRGVAGWMFVNRKQLCAMKWYGRGSIADPDLRKLRRKIDRALEALDAYHGFSWLPANIPQHSPRRRWFALRCTGYGRKSFFRLCLRRPIPLSPCSTLSISIGGLGAPDIWASSARLRFLLLRISSGCSEMCPRGPCPLFTAKIP
jgi:hypothetical protein